jgi:hypothetical protein
MKWGDKTIRFSDRYRFSGEKIMTFWERIIEFFRRLFGGR